MIDRQLHWDNRFRLDFGPRNVAENSSIPGEVKINALGRKGWDKLVQMKPDLRHHPVPLSARIALPAMYLEGEIISVSHLTDQFPKPHPLHKGFEKAVFLPPEPVFGGTFSVALAGL